MLSLQQNRLGIWYSNSLILHFFPNISTEWSFSNCKISVWWILKFADVHKRFWCIIILPVCMYNNIRWWLKYFWMKIGETHWIRKKFVLNHHLYMFIIKVKFLGFLERGRTNIFSFWFLKKDINWVYPIKTFFSFHFMPNFTNYKVAFCKAYLWRMLLFYFLSC